MRYCDAIRDGTWPTVARRCADNSIPSGRTVIRTFLNDQSVDYFLRAPNKRSSDQRLLIAVHGIRRNPLQHMIHLSSVAETLGAVLIAPYFPKNEYPRFQRLRANNGRLRPDDRLDRIIDDACRLADLQNPIIDLFGFSAGAQFVHRYAMAFPARISHVICASAGWYTLPSFDLDFPLGLRQQESQMRWRFNPQAFSLIPILVAVGDQDVRRSVSLNIKPEVDATQGQTRVERALVWVDAMNEIAVRFGNEPNVTFKSLGRSGHSIRRCVSNGGLGHSIREFLSNDYRRAE